MVFFRSRRLSTCQNRGYPHGQTTSLSRLAQATLEVSSDVLKTPEKSRYDATIGALVGNRDNPLWHVSVEGHSGTGTADIHLCVRGPLVDSPERDSFKRAVRDYFAPSFAPGEGMRCWFGVKNNPRITLWLARTHPLIAEVSFANRKVLSLVEQWCAAANLP